MPAWLFDGTALQLLGAGAVTPPAAPVNRGRVGRITASLSSGAITPPTNARDALVYGNYNPSVSIGGGVGIPVGPLPGSTLTVFNGDFVVSGNNQTVKDLDIYGSVNCGSFSNTLVQNCIVRGTLTKGVLTGHVFGSGDNLRGAVVKDTSLIGRGNFWCSAIRGDRFSLERVEVTNCPDGIGFTGVGGSRSVRGCWIHNGLYAEWTVAEGPVSGGGNGTYPAAGSYYSHNDGVQFYRGSNDVVIGNMIGGVREPWDHHMGKANEINTGDDLYNAALMIKQEVDNAPANKIQNVVIEKNWLTGGAATVNITTPGADASGPKNLFESVFFRNNRFIRSTWDAKLSARVGNDGLPMTSPQIYILRDPGLAVVSGNVFDDNGAAVPITNGTNNP